MVKTHTPYIYIHIYNQCMSNVSKYIKYIFHQQESSQKIMILFTRFLTLINIDSMVTKSVNNGNRELNEMNGEIHMK